MQVSWFGRKRKEVAPETEVNPTFETTQDRGEPAAAGKARRARHLQTSVAKVTYGANLVEAATKQLMSVMATINEQTAKQQAATSQAAAIITELSAFSQEVTASVNEVGSSSQQSAIALQQGKEQHNALVDCRKRYFG